MTFEERTSFLNVRKKSIVDEEIINLLNLREIKDNFKTINRIYWNGTILNYLKGMNLEESIVKRMISININKEYLKLILCDTSFSMRHYKNKINHIIENIHKNHIIFFHNEYIYDYAQERTNINFSGKTSYLNPLTQLSSILSAYNITCHIEHISDGEVTDYEANETINLIHSFNPLNINYKYREVNEGDPSYFHNELKNILVTKG